ncbi:predicted protein [Naegleria gruberi]|uniref:Dolichyl-diphosphooligosaccharide--protein glycosyltransferase subunit OST2 n=1 Tax=Naegleria gruberi TaxID=5762 RepID=D2VEM7_NAEGR|nr:uncharacterized protein NAEGRDRAFT_67330 [Naegleria gruberi]EFC44526.1 predicted protein [Naegleria gruberi]|eukprot:XP_002677270.1 predicted protein [Naegleria gruberi strain NEG-M]
MSSTLASSQRSSSGSSAVASSDFDANSGSIITVIKTLFENYSKRTSQRVKIVDQYILLCVLVAVVQFVYCQIVGTFPFNAMLAGFFTCICSMVFAVSLRKQLNPDTAKEFKTIVLEKSIADFVIISILLFFVAVSYLG